MEKALSRVAVTENNILPLTRFDTNISNTIVYTIKEQNITDVLIGLHHEAEQKDFLGPVPEKIIKRTCETIYIYKPLQPVNTLRRMVVVAPPKAELEPGFSHWLLKLAVICKEAGISAVFYGDPITLKEMQQQLVKTIALNIEFKRFSKWDDFLFLSRELKPDDLFVIIASRKGHVSYMPYLNKLPYYLTANFTANSYLLLYPKQLDLGVHMDDIEHADSNLIRSLSVNAGRIRKAAGYLRRVFSRK